MILYELSRWVEEGRTMKDMSGFVPESDVRKRPNAEDSGIPAERLSGVDLLLAIVCKEIQEREDQAEKKEPVGV